MRRKSLKQIFTDRNTTTRKVSRKAVWAGALAAALTVISPGAGPVSATDPDTLGRNSGYVVISEEEIAFYQGMFGFSRPGHLETFEEKVERSRQMEATSYESDNTYISTEQTHLDGASFITAHVIIRDPSQIFVEYANGEFGGERERPTDCAGRTGAVLVINGSYFDYGTGEAMYAVAPVILHDEEIVRNGVTNGSEVCIFSDGTLFSPHPGMHFSGDTLYEMGVKSNVGTADPLLIQDGNLESFPAGVASNIYPRTAIGMVSPGEYYFLVAGSGGYKGGLSYKQMQGIFYALGCDYARSLDGGGSSAMVINGKLMNTPAEGPERAVVDFICISD